MIKRYVVKSYKQYETKLLRILYVIASDNYSKPWQHWISQVIIPWIKSFNQALDPSLHSALSPARDGINYCKWSC